MHNQNGTIIAGVVAGLSFGLYCVSLVALFTRVDDRLILTYPETFAGLADIRDIFLASTGYSLLMNPPRVDHVVFPATPDTREDFDDLQRRGLLRGQVFNASLVVPDLSLLHRLMRVSWCSSGVGRTDILPALRNAGCRCISNAYLGFIQESMPSNATGNLTGALLSSLTVTNVSLDVRQRAGDKVFRCWDQQLVTRSRHCGRVCTTHVGTLAVFANIVLTLVCVSYVAFQALDWNVYVTKFAIVCLAGVLSIALLVRDADVNSIMLAGVGVSLFYLTITLHDDLSFPSEGPGPHPLVSAFMLNLPLMLSAHTVQIGVSGYGRDLWVFASFGVCGALLGVVAQVPPCVVFPCGRPDPVPCFSCSACSGTRGSACSKTRNGCSSISSPGCPSWWRTRACRCCSCCCSWRTTTSPAPTSGRRGACSSSTSCSSSCCPGC